MYGISSLGYGHEYVHSFNALIDAIKHRQKFHPRNRFFINLAGNEIEVNLRSNGYLEFFGEVQPVAVEKEIEDALTHSGALLSEYPR